MFLSFVENAVDQLGTIRQETDMHFQQMTESMQTTINASTVSALKGFAKRTSPVTSNTTNSGEGGEQRFRDILVFLNGCHVVRRDKIAISYIRQSLRIL
jgi:hypothetical protein